jgi:hypothetical protein
VPTPPIPYKTVTGRYDGPDGTDVAGVTLRFIPSTTVVDAGGNVVVPALPITVITDGTGAFSVNLMVTDDPDTNPTGWSWRLSELFPGGREVDFFVPSTSPASVAFADLTPATDIDERYAYTTTATTAALDARMTSLEATAAIVNAGAVLIHPYIWAGI